QVKHPGDAKIEAGEVYRSINPFEPRQLESPIAAPGVAFFDILKNPPTFLSAERLLPARRKHDWFDPPLPFLDFLAFRRLPCGFHRFVDSVAQDGTFLLRAVVVLARRDVARAAGEVDLEDARFVLSAFVSCQSAEIAGNPAVAVITHGMGGI